MSGFFISTKGQVFVEFLSYYLLALFELGKKFIHKDFDAQIRVDLFLCEFLASCIYRIVVRSFTPALVTTKKN